MKDDIVQKNIYKRLYRILWRQNPSYPVMEWVNAFPSLWRNSWHCSCEGHWYRFRPFPHREKEGYYWLRKLLSNDVTVRYHSRIDCSSWLSKIEHWLDYLGKHACLTTHAATTQLRVRAVTLTGNRDESGCITYQ